MSTRPLQDWSPLGVSGDPIPGDAADVQHFSGVIRSTATTLNDAQAALRPLVDGDMIGKRVNSLKAESGSVSHELGRVQVRYDAAAAALTTYGNQLADYQQRSLDLLRSVGSQAEQLNRALAQEQAEYDNLSAMQPSPERDSRIHDYSRLQAHRAQLQSEVAIAKAKLQSIIDARDRDADQAASAIENALDESGLNDTVWDKFTEAVNSVTTWTIAQLDQHADLIANILSGISMALFIVALILPGIGPALILASSIVSLVGALFESYSAFRKAQKDGNWANFAVTAAFGVLSAVSVMKAARALSVARSARLAEQGMKARNFKEFLRMVNGKKKLSTIRKIILFDDFDHAKQYKAAHWLLHKKLGFSGRTVKTVVEISDKIVEKTAEEALRKAGDRLPRLPLTVQRTECTPMAVAT